MRQEKKKKGQAAVGQSKKHEFDPHKITAYHFNWHLKTGNVYCGSKSIALISYLAGPLICKSDLGAVPLFLNTNKKKNQSENIGF